MAHLPAAHTFVVDDSARIPPENLELVVFTWSNEHGHCYECGVPAAYALKGYKSKDALRCAVCAALVASEGEEIEYLFKEYYVP